MKAWTPRSLPLLIKRAMSAMCVAAKPRAPGQNLVEERVGEWMMNSSVCVSNVAVVSIPLTYAEVSVYSELVDIYQDPFPRQNYKGVP